MKTATDSELIAPCGMNCALCSGYLAPKHDLKIKGVSMSYCAGCRPRNKKCTFLKKHCSKLSNGDVKFCFECSGFPCDQLKALDARYKALFRMSMIDNLNAIKKDGIEKFLDDQEQLWKCPKCNELICCHNGICYNCDLDLLRNKKQKYRWEL